MSLSLFSFQNVQPKAGTPGVAQDAPAGSAQGAPPPFSAMTMLLPLLMFVVLFFIMGRRQKKEQQARSGLKRGDRVVSNAGLIGELVEMDERTAKVKIAPGVTVTMVTATISPFEEAAKKEASKDAKVDLKDAKVAVEKK